MQKEAINDIEFVNALGPLLRDSGFLIVAQTEPSPSHPAPASQPPPLKVVMKNRIMSELQKLKDDNTFTEEQKKKVQKMFENSISGFVDIS